MLRILLALINRSANTQICSTVGVAALMVGVSSCTPDEAVVVSELSEGTPPPDAGAVSPQPPAMPEPVASPPMTVDAGQDGEAPETPAAPFLPQPTQTPAPPDEGLAEYALDCDGYAQKLRDCELVSDGPLYCDPPASESERCMFVCHAIASCRILQQYNCSDAVPAALDRCFGACYAAYDTFQCDTGELVPRGWRCDGESDCSDGSDERDCNDFECADGAAIPSAWRCDYQPDCADASDEVGCPARFSCGSGEEIPENWECDGEPDCTDDSDESECTWFTCETTGEQLSPRLQCNQVDDCLDGSDEVGCAELQCH